MDIFRARALYNAYRELKGKPLTAEEAFEWAWLLKHYPHSTKDIVDIDEIHLRLCEIKHQVRVLRDYGISSVPKQFFYDSDFARLCKRYGS